MGYMLESDGLTRRFDRLLAAMQRERGWMALGSLSSRVAAALRPLAGAVSNAGRGTDIGPTTADLGGHLRHRSAARPA
jgi:hypothetical protein